MIHIVVFAKVIDGEQALVVKELIDKCAASSIKLSFFEAMYEETSKWLTIPTDIKVIHSVDFGHGVGVDFLFSLGGDGTLLEASMIIGDSGIPIVGINMGRLGFLASIEKKLITQTIDKLINGEYSLEKRALLHFTSNEDQFSNFPYALNDMTLIKREHSSMVVIHTVLNGEFLNSYWADGVILSTPTGSTGYNLSCGGPILMPASENFIITPIAPHNLSVRPLVVPDSAILEFTIEGRGENYLCTLDSRYEMISQSTKIKVKKAPFAINLVKLPKITFMKTMRDKLQWGRDTRNYKK